MAAAAAEAERQLNEAMQFLQEVKAKGGIAYGNVRFYQLFPYNFFCRYGGWNAKLCAFYLNLS